MVLLCLNKWNGNSDTFCQSFGDGNFCVNTCALTCQVVKQHHFFLLTLVGGCLACGYMSIAMLAKKYCRSCVMLNRVVFSLETRSWRNFKLADEQGNWVHCGGHGRHAENNSLENCLRIVVYFGSGRSASGNSPPAIWLFKDAFIVPLERCIGSPLSEQVVWQ